MGEFAAEKLKGTEIPLVALPGNDDFHEIDEILTQPPHFDFHEMQVCEFKGGYQMLYCGGSTPTPWDTEREYYRGPIRQRASPSSCRRSRI